MNYLSNIEGVEQLSFDASLAYDLTSELIPNQFLWARQGGYEVTPWLASLPPQDDIPQRLHHPDHRPHTKIFRYDDAFVVRSFKRFTGKRPDIHDRTRVVDYIVSSGKVIRQGVTLRRDGRYKVSNPQIEKPHEVDPSEYVHAICTNWPVLFGEALRQFHVNNHDLQDAGQRFDDEAERYTKRHGHWVIRRAEQKHLGESPYFLG